MKRWMTALGTTLVTMTAAGCAPLVLDPVQRQDSTASTSAASGGGTSSGDPAPGTTVIAALFKDIPVGPPSTQASNPAGYLTGADPDTLVLMWSNEPLSCADPEIGVTCNGGTVWQGVLAIPPDLVRVGLVDLANPRIRGLSYAYSGEAGSTACSGGGGGGGPLEGGTVEIVSTDSGTITVNLLTGLLGSPGETINGVVSAPVTLQGMYTASRCEPAPTPPAPRAAVAITGANLPAGLPASPTIGTSPDPTAIYLFVGTTTQTCADPLSSVGCDGAARMTIAIPAALQVPGTLQLSNPQLATSIEIAADSGTANCTSSVDAAFMAGTLTIHSVDAGGISFSLYQSLTVTTLDVDADLDGLYQAPLCP
jgi:hypothetical protein